MFYEIMEEGFSVNICRNPIYEKNHCLSVIFAASHFVIYAWLLQGDVFPARVMQRQLLLKCSLTGVLGGTLYCLRVSVV